MAGAWEQLNNNLVLAAVIHTETTTVAWALGLRNVQIPGKMIGSAGAPFDHARNGLIHHMLQNGFQYIFFIDSDVIPPPDCVHRLLRHRQPIVSGLYCRRSKPHGVPVALKNGQWLTSIPGPGQNPVLEVDLVGAGCLLIHRSVLEKPLPHARPGKPFFDWKVDMAGLVPNGEALSEDFTFCLNARRAGYKIILDTSVRCLHVGLAQAEFGSLVPLESNAAA